MAEAIRAPASEGARRRRHNGRAACAPHIRPQRRETSSPLSVGAARLIMAQRPPLSMSKLEHAPAPLHAGGRLALARGHEQSAQAPEAVGGREPERREFAERFFELRTQEARRFRELVKEQGAARA